MTKKEYQDKISQNLNFKGLKYSWSENPMGVRCLTVKVPMKIMEQVSNKFYDGELYLKSEEGFTSDLEQITPKLVPAKIGNYVMVYNKNCCREEYFDIGIVSSVRKDKNGNISYGCRHIFVDNAEIYSYSFRLTEEDFGGYPSGFFKVLSEKKATSLLKERFSKEAEEWLENRKKEIEKLNLKRIRGYMGDVIQVSTFEKWRTS